ncbi:MAG: sigma-70 family RNA polymerase sigma factor [Kiritimatiellae bacterium]|nr:sigma-70 family RNA polymerase sigma factor [Kiritimatiellia bacterium]
MKKEFTSQDLAEAFAEHRARLLSLVEKRLNPILLKRLSHEDVMQEVYLAAVKRLTYFAQNEDVPIYFKLRTILLQTLADIERKNLQAAGRDAYREAEVEDDTTSKRAPGALNWGQFAADVTSPLSCVDRNERHALLRAAIAELPENDRAIIVLRHFDGMGNTECATALGLQPKAASIRYIRALERLQQMLMEVSCFKPNPTWRFPNFFGVKSVAPL